MARSPAPIPTPVPDPVRARAEARQMRLIGLVIAGTTVLWLAANWLGPWLGLAGEYAFLIDLAAMAAFVWALVLAVALWRGRPGGNR